MTPAVAGFLAGAALALAAAALVGAYFYSVIVDAISALAVVL